jgi:glycosyltransferase involved in cell wall biosynthesis
MHYIPLLPKRYLRYKIAKHTNYYYNRTRHVIAPSAAAERSLRRHKVSAPISVIPSGVPAPRKLKREDARHLVGARPCDRIMLYVGRIAKEKNIDVLFEMAAKAMSQRDDLRFWLVGDGPHRSDCHSLARSLGIGDRVRFMYYRASDVFVFASMTETQGLVVSEAMSHGLPAVAVHGGGASASIRDGENGFIVANNPRQFAETVLKLIGNPSLLGRLSESAKRSVKLWTQSDMCDAVVGVYESALLANRDERSTTGGLAVVDS